MTSTRQPGDEEVEDAILAFDAGNHAWGRYRHFVLSALTVEPPLAAAPVREALQEAAICVPDARAGAIAPFLAALESAHAGMVRYRGALPAGIQATEIEEAIGDLAEAIALLHGDPPPEG